jgi:hypothetical protein
MKRIFILISFFCLAGVANVLFAQIVKINSNHVIEADGTVRADGAATTFDDILVPFTQAKQGSNSKPDFDFTNVGLLFPQNDALEKIYLVVQIPHSYKLASSIYPHIHWQQTSSSFPIWKMDYKWFNIGDPIPGSFTTIQTNTGVKTYSTGSLHQVSSFGEISGAANSTGGGLSPIAKGISSILLIKLYRDDNVAIGDVLGFQFDIHYEKDTEGSRDEFEK